MTETGNSSSSLQVGLTQLKFAFRFMRPELLPPSSILGRL